jgi:hypothetical protein
MPFTNLKESMSWAMDLIQFYNNPFRTHTNIHTCTYAHYFFNMQLILSSHHRPAPPGDLLLGLPTTQLSSNS